MRTLAPIVVSGGEVPQGLRSRFQLPAKSLITCRGKSLLAHSIHALLESECASRPIAVVGPAGVQDELAQFGDAVKWLHCGNTLMDNAAIGMRFHGEGKDLLILSPDLPAVTGAAIDLFVNAIPADAEIAVPIVTREQFLRRFPGAPNKFVRTAEGEITMCSAFFFTGRALKMNLGLGTDTYKSRKNPIKLAAILGLGVVFQLLNGKLRIEAVESRVSRICDAQARAVRVDAPELAYDVDCWENIDFLERCSR
jgi:GTP:adenosylcobinamide-phosphate guanylyltransferase